MTKSPSALVFAVDEPSKIEAITVDGAGDVLLAMSLIDEEGAETDRISAFRRSNGSLKYSIDEPECSDGGAFLATTRSWFWSCSELEPSVGTKTSLVGFDNETGQQFVARKLQAFRSQPTVTVAGDRILYATDSQLYVLDRATLETRTTVSGTLEDTNEGRALLQRDHTAVIVDLASMRSRSVPLVPHDDLSGAEGHLHLDAVGLAYVTVPASKAQGAEIVRLRLDGRVISRTPVPSGAYLLSSGRGNETTYLGQDIWGPSVGEYHFHVMHVDRSGKLATFAMPDIPKIDQTRIEPTLLSVGGLSLVRDDQRIVVLRRDGNGIAHDLAVPVPHPYFNVEAAPDDQLVVSTTDNDGQWAAVMQVDLEKTTHSPIVVKL